MPENEQLLHVFLGGEKFVDSLEFFCGGGVGEKGSKVQLKIP